MLVFWILACLVAVSYGEDCWWTGCQLDSWAEKGCAQYNRQERNRRRCQTNNGPGYEYQCCTGGNDGDGGGGGSGEGDSVSSISYNQFSQAVTSNPPDSNGKWPRPSQSQYNAFIKAAGPKGGIANKREAAMALANFLQESDGLKAKREYACENNGCPGHYEGIGCERQGQRYYGRGYIQLTWCYNYRDASVGLYGNENVLLNDPDKVAREEQLAWDTAFWFWKDRVRGQQGVQQGKFGSSIRAINGQQECGGGAPYPQKAQRRKNIYVNVRRAFGLQGPGNHEGC